MGSPGDKSRGNWGTSVDTGGIVQVKDGLGVGGAGGGGLWRWNWQYLMRSETGKCLHMVVPLNEVKRGWGRNKFKRLKWDTEASLQKLHQNLVCWHHSEQPSGTSHTGKVQNSVLFVDSSMPLSKHILVVLTYVYKKVSQQVFIEHQLLPNAVLGMSQGLCLGG